MHLLSFASLLSSFFVCDFGFVFVFVFVSFFACVLIQIQRRAGAHPISQLYHALARHGHFDVINAARPKYAKSLPRKVAGKQQLSIGECSYANCRRAHFIVLLNTTLLYCSTHAEAAHLPPYPESLDFSWISPTLFTGQGFGEQRLLKS